MQAYLAKQTELNNNLQITVTLNKPCKKNVIYGGKSDVWQKMYKRFF